MSYDSPYSAHAHNRVCCLKDITRVRKTPTTSSQCYAPFPGSPLHPAGESLGTRLVQNRSELASRPHPDFVQHILLKQHINIQ